MLTSPGFFFIPFPNKPWFLRVCITRLLKTLWEKEKLLVTSNFSFSHSVFYPFEELPSIFIIFEIVVCKLFHFGRVQNLSFGKGLKKPTYSCLSWVSPVLGWGSDEFTHVKLFCHWIKSKAFADKKTSLTQKLKFVLED